MRTFVTPALLPAACIAIVVGIVYGSNHYLAPKESALVSATAVGVCSTNGEQLAAMIVTHKDGTVERLDYKNMGRFKSAKEIYEYAAQAPNVFGYDLGECGQGV